MNNKNKIINIGLQTSYNNNFINFIFTNKNLHLYLLWIIKNENNIGNNFNKIISLG